MVNFFIRTSHDKGRKQKPSSDVAFRSLDLIKFWKMFCSYAARLHIYVRVYDVIFANDLKKCELAYVIGTKYGSHEKSFNFIVHLLPR